MFGNPIVARLSRGFRGSVRWPVSGSVSICVQKRLNEKSGHGKRLINQIDLTHKEFDHDHSEQA